MINLVVSSGPDQVAMPSTVIGETEADARAVLEAEPYNFRVVTSTEETLDVAAGLVIRTNPAAQTLVAKGSQVTIFVSSGAPTAEVPNVVGQTEAAARAALAAFDVSVTSQDLPFGDANDGRVTAQSVAGGQRAPEGSPIQLTVGRAGPAPTTTQPPPRRRRRPPPRRRPRPPPRSSEP